jgi:hypothetical protein
MYNLRENLNFLLDRFSGRGEFGAPLKLHRDQEGRSTTMHSVFSQRGEFYSGNE